MLSVSSVAWCMYFHVYSEVVHRLKDTTHFRVRFTFGKNIGGETENICDPIYRNPVKRFDNINFDSLHLKNYSTNLLCFRLEKMRKFPISFQDKNKVNWLNSF